MDAPRQPPSARAQQLQHDSLALLAGTVDPLTAAVTTGAVVMFVSQEARRRASVLLAVLFVSFATVLSSPGLRPHRYWIYATPVLAIVLAGALEHLWDAAIERRGRRWWRASVLAVAAVLIVANVAAIRLEFWRHRLTDVFMVLDYVRVAELVRADLGGQPRRDGHRRVRERPRGAAERCALARAVSVPEIVPGP